LPIFLIFERLWLREKEKKEKIKNKNDRMIE
jgi:hypothetical protein